MATAALVDLTVTDSDEDGPPPAKLKPLPPKPPKKMFGGLKKPAGAQVTLMQAWCGSPVPKKKSDENSVDTSPPVTEPVEATEWMYKKKPYYWKIVTAMITSVLQDKFEGRFLSPRLRQKLLLFTQLSHEEQKLAVRLFLRRHVWLRRKDVKYPEVSFDIPRVLLKLEDARIIRTPADDVDVPELLNMLRAPEIQSVAGKFRLEKKSTIHLKDQLCKLCNKRDSFASQRGSTLTEKIKAACMPFVSDCFRVSQWFIDAMNGVFFVYTMFTPNLVEVQTSKDELFDAGSIVYRVLQINENEVLKVNRTVALFNQETFNAYHELKKLQYQLTDMMRNKDFLRAVNLLMTSLNRYECLCDTSLVDSEKLPAFLRKYSVVGVMNRLRALLVEFYCKVRNYSAACRSMKMLIESGHKKGDMLEKLALTLCAHLGQKGECIEVMKSAFGASNIPDHNLIALAHRAHGMREKHTKTKKKKDSDKEPQVVWNCDLVERQCCRILERYDVAKIETTRIFGSRAPSVKDHQSLQFIYRHPHRNGTVMCSVEEFVIAHLKDHESFSHGVHREGALFKTLFFALMADIVFTDDVDNVVFSQHQVVPLDWMTHDFSANREQLMTKRYGEIENSFKRNDLVSKNYENYPNSVEWSMFATLEDLCDLLNCFEATQLAQIFNFVLADCSFSGMPDLTLWDRGSGRVCLVEVKAPGDSLSNKQVVWLHRLATIGVSSRVVHVDSHKKD